MGKRLRGISCSDWHLDGLAKLFPNDHIQRQLAEIDKIYNYALDNGIEHIFIPGDISDSYKMPWETYIELYLFFKKYDGRINSYYIGGNHDHQEGTKTSVDFLELLSKDNTFKTLKIYKSAEQVKIEGIYVNMLPHLSEGFIEAKKPCLNFVHTSYDGAVGDNGCKIRIKKEFTPPPGDFTISGHIHQWQFLKSRNILFNGNPFQKNFGESLPKGFIDFTAKYKSGKLVVDFDFINNRPDFILESVIIKKQKDFTKLSKEDNIRYRLYVDPKVVIPSDLRMKYPNVAQILDSGGKKKLKELEDASEFKQHAIAVPKVDPLSTLEKDMADDGWSPEQYAIAENFVNQSISTFNTD